MITDKKVKVVLVAILMLFSAQTVFSQNAYLGLKGGFNESNFSTSKINNIHLNPIPTYNFAFVFSGKLRDRPFGMSLEPGTVLTGTDLNSDSLKYKMRFVNMPVLLDYYPTKKLKLSAGLEPAYLIGAKRQSKGSAETSVTNIYNRKFNLFANIGLSYSVKYFMDFGLRYSESLTALSHNDEVFQNHKITNGYLQLFILLKIAN